MPRYNFKSQKYPILMYHSLSYRPQKNKYTLTKQVFDEHLIYLNDKKINCITANEYFNYITSYSDERDSPKIIITFDDGNESDYTIALKLLEKHGYAKATFFITTDWIDKPGFMTSRQIRDLRDAGMSIQSHAKSHRFLNELNSTDIFSELKESKERLEDLLGEAVQFISFPGGRYSPEVITTSASIGYTAVFSSEPFALRFYNGIYLFGRFGVKSTTIYSKFQKIVNGNAFNIYGEKINYKLKYILKTTLGNKLYYFLWKIYRDNNSKHYLNTI